MTALESITNLMTIADAGICLHRTNENASIVGIDATLDDIAVANLACTLLYLVAHEHTGKCTTACIAVNGPGDGDVLYAHVVDGAQHLAEDADGREVFVVGLAANLAIADAEAAAVVVALEGNVIADRGPLAAAMVGLQDVRHQDVFLLLEIDIARVVAAIHIVNKV